MLSSDQYRLFVRVTACSSFAEAARQLEIPASAVTRRVAAIEERLGVRLLSRTFESPILAQLPQSQVDYMRSKIPMGRLGEVAESAAMVCFMASEECSFTTASTFDTSGGRTTF